MATTDSRGCGEIEQKPRTDGKATPRVCVCVLFAVSCWWRPPRATMRGRPGACQMLTPCQLGSLPTPTCTRMNSLVLCDGDVYKKMLDSEGKTERRCPRCQIRSFTFLSLSPPLFLSLAHTYTHPSTHARSLQLTLGSTEGKENAAHHSSRRHSLAILISPTGPTPAHQPENLYDPSPTARFQIERSDVRRNNGNVSNE